MTDQEFQPPTTPQHPLEQYPGRTKRLTLPALGIEVVIRKVGIKTLTSDIVMEEFIAGDLLSAANKYGVQVNRATGGTPNESEIPLDPQQLVGVVKKLRDKLMKEAVIAPKLAELIDMVGGDPESVDLGLGEDYEVLADAVEEFNDNGLTVNNLIASAGKQEKAKKAGDARARAATAFPGTVGSGAGQNGEGLREKAK